jgi:hypothetical protein
VVFSTSLEVADDVDDSDALVGVSVDGEVTSMETSDDSVVEISSRFNVVDSAGSSEVPSLVKATVVEATVDASPPPVDEVKSPDEVDCVTLSKLVLELPALSPGNVDVDSDSVFSVVDSEVFIVVSETFVVEGVVGRVMSGGQGLSFVVLLIVGRVGRIDESDEELSELDENSVEVESDVSDEVSTVLVDEASSIAVELVLLESKVVLLKSKVVLLSVSVEKLESVVDSVDLLRSRTSTVVVEKEPSKDVGTDCVIVDV